jgi:O-acetyl-ADP-ribose deacetylase (regulator of RNase III)
MLFVKESSYDRPMWDALRTSLTKLAKKVKKKNIKKLAMPKICCGKNGFDWEDVRDLIVDVFSDNDDLEIVICCK